MKHLFRKSINICVMLSILLTSNQHIWLYFLSFYLQMTLQNFFAKNILITILTQMRNYINISCRFGQQTYFLLAKSTRNIDVISHFPDKAKGVLGELYSNFIGLRLSITCTLLAKKVLTYIANIFII